MLHPHILAVMGLTGAGKSSFVRLVTGNSSAVVGDLLSSGGLLLVLLKTYLTTYRDKGDYQLSSHDSRQKICSG